MANYLIIGASLGISKALALQMAENGYRIFGTYNKNEMVEFSLSIKASWITGQIMYVDGGISTLKI